MHRMEERLLDFGYVGGRNSIAKTAQLYSILEQTFGNSWLFNVRTSGVAGKPKDWSSIVL